MDYYYEDYGWGDLLTYCYYGGAYGAVVSHDAIGNMLSDGERTYTWRYGRELTTLTKDGKTWNFTYDADGMRTSRVYGNTYYKYAYNGGQLSWMDVIGNILRFTYDASGKPVSVTYNGVLYYVTNLCGLFGKEAGRGQTLQCCNLTCCQEACTADLRYGKVRTALP